MRRNALLLLVVLSFVSWSSWTMARDLRSPFGDLSAGIFTDHLSHMNRVRALFHVGLDLYRRPLDSHFQRVTDAELPGLPDDIRATGAREVFVGDGFTLQKPFIASWSMRPAMHPPGDVVLLGPVAAAYSWTNLSFTEANRWLVVSCLLYAHLAFYFFVRAFFSRPGAVGLIACTLVYLELVRWALEGFYESADIVPLALAGIFLGKRRYLGALVAYAAATTIHFRALFLAPWALVAIVGLVRERAWRSWRARDFAAAGVGVALAAVSLGVFAILWPTLKSLPQSTDPFGINPLTADAHEPFARAELVVFVIVVSSAFAYGRAWLDLAVLAWMTFMFARLREAYPWDIVTIFGWLCGPIPAVASSRRGQLVRDARLLFVLFAAHLMFKNSLFPDWFLRVF